MECRHSRHPIDCSFTSLADKSRLYASLIHSSRASLTWSIYGRSVPTGPCGPSWFCLYFIHSFIPPWARASDMSMSFRLTVYIDVRWRRGVVGLKQPDHESIRETDRCSCLTMISDLSENGFLSGSRSTSRKVSYWVYLVDLAVCHSNQSMCSFVSLLQWSARVVNLVCFTFVYESYCKRLLIKRDLAEGIRVNMDWQGLLSNDL